MTSPLNVCIYESDFRKPKEALQHCERINGLENHFNANVFEVDYM